MPLSARARRVSMLFGVYTLIGGGISLLGWAADLPRLTDWFGHKISIQPNTSLATMAAGAGICLLATGRRHAARVCGAIVALFGASALFEYVSGIDLGIDTLLMFGRTWGRASVAYPGRMGPPGALSWTLLGTGLMLASTRASFRGRSLAPGLAFTAVGISSLSLIGYLYGVDPLYRIPTVTAIALQTATFVLASALALLSAIPDHGPARIVHEGGPAGLVFRRLMVPVVAIPIVLGLLCAAGERAGLYDSAFGTAVRTLTEIVLFMLLLGWTTRTISRQELRRRAAEESARSSREQLAAEILALSRLQALSTRLVPADALETLLKEILEASSDITGTDKGNIQFFNPSTGQLRLVVHQGLGEPFIAHYSEDGSEAACGLAAKRAERIIIEDVRTSPAFAGTKDLQVLLDDGIRGVVSTPLISREGRLLGMLNNHFRELGRPPENQLRYLDLLARMAADVVERSLSEAALRRADARKDEFLATLAHELRNPLAPLRTAMDILRVKGTGDAEAEWARGVAERQASVMARLLDDLLDVSRITRDKLELRKQRVELAAVIRSAVEASGPLLRQLGQEVVIHGPASPIWLDADPVRLGQVFGNLVNNACKYSDPKGWIEIAMVREGDEAVVYVRDQGIGIAADRLSGLFDMFSQGEHPLERSRGGLGIGLHLVKKLVLLHGGSVSALSEGPGRGSTFVVRLNGLIAEDAVAHAVPRPLEVALPTRRRVLIVDDNEDAAESLRILLSLQGHDTLLAHDGAEAVDKALAFRPHLILLDIGMPVMNGYEACRTIRSRFVGSQPVIVALTGWGQESDRELARQAGFDAHLAKPVDHRQLASLLERTLPAVLTVDSLHPSSGASSMPDVPDVPQV